MALADRRLDVTPSKQPAFDPEAALRALEAMGPVATFPWHRQQEVALRSATDITIVLGGNQSGKSRTGQGAISRLMRREGPIYGRLRNRERPLKIWIAPHTFEKYKSVWESYIKQACEGLEYTYVQTPHPLFTIEDKFGGVEVWGKAQEQGFMAFESDAVDLVVLDEEPEDPRVYRSCRARTSTTNGVILMTFTPLLGLSWTHRDFYITTVKPEFQIGDRAWRRGNDVTVVQMGMADNPESVAGGGVDRLVKDPGMTEAEKGSRLYGNYGYTEGLLIPQFADLYAENVASPYIIDSLPAGRPYTWVLTIDPNKRHGGLLTAIDHEENRYYVGEHYAENLPDTEHGRRYRDILKKWDLTPDDIPIFADPGGAGSQAIINLQEVGFFAAPIQKDPGSVSASIKRLRRAAWIDPRHRHPVTGKLGAPHVYFLRSLKSIWMDGEILFEESRLMYEFRQYRQKVNRMGTGYVAPDTPVKEKDDLVDCARYVELARSVLPEAPVTDEVREAREKLDPLSRKEHEAFDAMAAKAEMLYKRATERFQ